MRKIALVTGASRGIGQATAEMLASEGYAVCLNYFENQQKAERIASDIVRSGGTAFAFQADLGKEADIIRMFDQIDQTLGPISVLVNNAAIIQSNGTGMVEDISWNELDAVFKVNVFGVFIACREAINRMKNNGGGAIVNISSEAAKFGGNRMTAYASSKAAVNTMTIGIAREVAPYKIRVNSVSPGVINTNDQEATKERLATIPLGRLGKPSEVAELILWLLSDKASYVSGATFSVNGAR
jgi:NAD(P)-dependent dehydrogenase (short-subunit alcohol dehydrogenase family)